MMLSRQQNLEILHGWMTLWWKNWGKLQQAQGPKCLSESSERYGNMKLPCRIEALSHISHIEKKKRVGLLKLQGHYFVVPQQQDLHYITLQMIKGRTDKILADAQCGFRANRSTIDQIFTLGQLAKIFEEFERLICLLH